MNKLIYTGILTLAALSLGSCSEENRGLLGDAKGKIAMNLNVDSEVKTGKIGNDIVISRAAASKIEKEDLTLRPPGHPCRGFLRRYRRSVAQPAGM